ncbi:MAG: VCBS repeat-containing protein, partial [Deltaproteobacteria bacterium]|nr:VCBS repeat-containing protein [Deltaproteobacteria bacterium]
MTPSQTRSRRALSALALAALLLVACAEDAPGADTTTDSAVTSDVASEVQVDSAATTTDATADEVDGAEVTPDDTGADPEVATDTTTLDDTIAETDDDVATTDSYIKDGDDLDADPDVAPDAGPVVCDPPLALTPSEVWLLPLGAVDLTASGGTGAYRFAVASGSGDALLNPLTGYYLAGHDPGVDTVALTDLGCVGAATIEVHTVPPLAVAPTRVEVLPGAGLTLDIAGGSGALALSLEAGGAGGVVEGTGRYTAPAAEGEDTILVTDTRTGEVVAVAVMVTLEATPDLVPAAAFVPLGSALTLSASGGSGDYTLAVEGDLPLDAGTGLTWSAPTPGASTLVATDRFTGLTSTARAFGLVPLAHEVSTSAAPAYTPTVVAADLDGDAFTDLVVGVPELTLDRATSGGVFVYAGTAEGADPTPRQVLSGSSRNEQHGRALALADLDGDGARDLLVGVALADGPGLADRGHVALHLGLGDGTFEALPARTWPGARAGDNLGTSIAVCDLDADGLLDLAFGAPQGEDATRTPIVSAHGLVEVRLATGPGLAGLPDAPTAVRFGLVPGEAPAPLENYRLGAALATGDLDGDGACDLVAAATGADSSGAVLVYRGLADGGLTAAPVRAWTGLATGVSASRLGQVLAVGDVDGDGADDLLMSQRVWSTVPSANNQFGA